MSLRHLFDAELEYRADAAPVAATGEGQLVGSGVGSVRGDELTGTMRWTLFEHPGELVCGMNPTAVIDTDDGAQIRVDGRGFARRESREQQRWQVAATLLFHSADERFAWLDGALGVWEGEFDARTHRAHYRTYAAAEGVAPPAASFTRAEDWRTRRAQLEPQERALYRDILLGFARGEPPTPESLAAVAADLDVELASALARFDQLDLVRTDAATGAVVVAYPFSGRPTAHRLELSGGRTAYAMCAVDALGVAAMLGSRVQIRSLDPITSKEIVVDVSPGGEARWSPKRAAVFVGGRDGEESISDLCCPVVNFFASPETAREYHDTHPDLVGEVVGVPEALAGGHAIFEEALT